jgi:hypothetical protein
MLYTSDAIAIVDIPLPLPAPTSAGRRTRCAGCVDARADRRNGATRRFTKGGPSQKSPHALLVQGQCSGWSFIVCDRASGWRALEGTLRKQALRGERQTRTCTQRMHARSRKIMRIRHSHTAHARTHTHVHTNRQHSWKKRSSAKARANFLSDGDEKETSSSPFVHSPLPWSIDTSQEMPLNCLSVGDVTKATAREEWEVRKLAPRTVASC